ncbi:MAG: hypothetical protein E7549_00090 [Ruminococcaceae bacterium]|nr:hypothetical protein [Oscillospiraceae bacterium]
MGLLDFLKQLPSVNELKGSLGEQLTKYYAKAMTDTLVLHDVLIDGDDGKTSQIDLVLVGIRGLYVVEVKMFSDANIYGDAKKSQWYYYAGKKRYNIYNPLKQNEKHILYLKEFLKEFGDIPCFSIITLICNNFKISNLQQEEGNRKIAVCSSLPTMEKAIKIIAQDHPIVWDEAKKQQIFDYIQKNQHIGKDARIQHKQNVIAYKESLETKKAEKVCPYCNVPLVLRHGKFGEFYGCPNYPKCRYTLK